MKKIKIIILLVMCGFSTINIMSSQENVDAQNITESSKDVAPRKRNTVARNKRAMAVNSPSRRPRIERGQKRQVTTQTNQRRGRLPQKTAQVRGKTRGQQVQVAVPEDVDVLVWQSLSKGEQAEFKKLNENFIKTVSTVSKNYNLWQNSVINQAKKMIDINKMLAPYCIEIISAELEKTGEERGINPSSKIQYIQATLEKYAVPKIVLTGTEKEQFEVLVQNVSINPENGLPTAQWLKDIIKRGISLVEKEELTAAQVRELLINALNDAYQQVSLDAKQGKVVEYVINAIKKNIEDTQLKSSPEYINQRFQDLLLHLSADAHWNNNNNRPNAQWINDIIEISKKMLVLFPRITIDTIEQQIGAQVYFVAAKKAGGLLSGQEQQSIIALVTAIKNKITS